MSDFVTVAEVCELSGKSYTEAEQVRISAIIPLVCDALRYEAIKVGKDLDLMVEQSGAYASVAKLVTVDVVLRAMVQTYDHEPMSQESQGALGYTWSGTYAIPGGGISGAIMRNDLKRLGLKRQTWGSVDICPELKA